MKNIRQWKEIHGITFYRKLENETAFDNMIKIYSFNTGIKNIRQSSSGRILR